MLRSSTRYCRNCGSSWSRCRTMINCKQRRQHQQTFTNTLAVLSRVTITPLHVHVYTKLLVRNLKYSCIISKSDQLIQNGVVFYNVLMYRTLQNSFRRSTKPYQGATSTYHTICACVLSSHLQMSLSLVSDSLDEFAHGSRQVAVQLRQVRLETTKVDSSFVKAHANHR